MIQYVIKGSICAYAIRADISCPGSFLFLERRSVAQESYMDSLYPSLLHLCAANGLTPVCDWLLHRYNTEDKRSLKNRDGHTPADLAENHNHTALKEVLQ